jgi:hypothetical protein
MECFQMAEKVDFTIMILIKEKSKNLITIFNEIKSL